VELEAQAREMRARFERAFWCPDIQMYALALDGAKQPCRVRTSNAGQVLFSGIAAPDRAKRVADALTSAEFFSGWGIRTVSRREARYNPMSYHNGSIWPHDNALIALGFGRYGLKQAVERVFKGMFDAAGYMDFRRLPELFCGFQRSRARGPTLYPVACSPQAWSAAAPFCLLQASLGLSFDPAARQIRFTNPRLPSFLDEVVLRQVALQDASADIAIHRRGDAVSLHVIETQGEVDISVMYSG
jgi:glycogen debranching enzyme